MRWLVLALALLAGVPGVAAAQTVAVTGGRIEGEKLSDGTYAFKGVPFARPPVGDLRWAPPRDPLPWSDVRPATESAPACTQADYGWNRELARTSQEDCLYLELRTPTLDAAARRPVIVFIHGGANRAGGAPGTIMSGFPSRGVVIVSIQYRLGVFGFLSHPALTAEGHGASGNYALMDQIKALQWVRANIAAFGGDPSNVTIVGHSAGAQDVGLLLSSPLARGLFAHAVEESGPPQFGLPPRSLKQNEAMGVALARPYSSHAPDSAAALADLRAAPADALQRAADKLPVPISDPSFIWLQAVVDGRILRKSPKQVFEAGEQIKVPLIIGTSAQELDLSGGDAAIYPTLAKAFGGKAGGGTFRVLAFYGLDVDPHPKPDPVLGPVAMQISTDLMMRCPSQWTAAHMPQAWMYQLDVDASGGTVHHGSELSFVFNPRPADKTLAQWPPLLDYWANFAATGNPNGPGLPQWPIYDGQANVLEFSPDGPVQAQGVRTPVCSRRDQP
jgi:para-nitrobenzyl esterase